jgi:putative endonuclease
MSLDISNDSPSWHVYLVRCADGSLYTGIATDVERRVQEHNSDDAVGAKYTRARRPVTLVYWEAVDSRSAALKREHAIKRLGKVEKEKMVRQTKAGW